MLILTILMAGPLEPSKVTASSSLPRWKKYTFAASNLVDGRVDTSWQPRSATGGVGEWFQIDFPATARVDECGIANGLQLFDELGDLFLLNNRVKSARLVFSEGEDQAIGFDPAQRGRVLFKVPHRKTKSVRLVVDEIEPGTKFKDLAVSEISCSGTAIVPGRIRGHRSYPSDYMPDMTIFAVEKNTGVWFKVEKGGASGASARDSDYAFELEVEPGTYIVFAREDDTVVGVYTECVQRQRDYRRTERCTGTGSNYQCHQTDPKWSTLKSPCDGASPDSIPVKVGPGETVEGIDLEMSGGLPDTISHPDR